MTEWATRDGSDRIRVLYLVGQLGFGGSEGQLRLLLENLDMSHWEPYVLIYHPSPNADHVSRLREAGVGVTTWPAPPRGPLHKLVFTSKVARRIRPDVIHSWSVHDNPYSAWAGRLAGVPVRWGSLRSSMLLPGFQSLPGWYRGHAVRAVDRVVVNSRALAHELLNTGLREDRVLLLPNCVDAGPLAIGEPRTEVLEEFGFTADHRVFASVGNIRRVKNQALFVRALAKVIADHPDVRGVIIGETLQGEEETRAGIEGEIERLGLDGKIVLAGFRADVRRLLAGMTGLCMTSDSEGMPNVVLEAMAAGVPVVATSVGGVPDVVDDGTTGFLVAAGDEPAFARAMRRVVDEPELAHRMTVAARVVVSEKRGCAAMANGLETAYSAALGGAGRS